MAVGSSSRGCRTTPTTLTSKNGLYFFQRVSLRLSLAAFVFYHVLSMKGWLGRAFVAENATASTIANIDAHWTVAYLIYPIGILAACFHTANGFWTAAVSWGLTISASSQRRWGWVCGVLFVGLTAAGLTAIIATIIRGHIR